MAGPTNSFRGFPKEFFAFFRELKANNERSWFEGNKERFRASVQAPMSDFIAAIAAPLSRVSKEFIADPRPNGGSMFRIYRDIRFSKDKRPYKEHGACQFRHRLGRDVHAPGFYVHLAPGEVFFGGGLWMPDAEALFKVRTAIASKTPAWTKIAAGNDFARRFGTVEGDALTRPPKGFPPAHPAIADLKRKSFHVMQASSEKDAQSRAFADEAVAAFKAASPLMRFLCDALAVSF
ncbi:MAG TPA: DUF2461 domain-containing protein [Micropepsaceae bacterium]|nr:DUF2461 domain-containing protein [Micropepsaceae bacterium]